MKMKIWYECKWEIVYEDEVWWKSCNGILEMVWSELSQIRFKKRGRKEREREKGEKLRNRERSESWSLFLLSSSFDLLCDSMSTPFAFYFFSDSENQTYSLEEKEREWELKKEKNCEWFPPTYFVPLCFGSFLRMKRNDFMKKMKRKKRKKRKRW